MKSSALDNDHDVTIDEFILSDPQRARKGSAKQNSNEVKQKQASVINDSFMSDPRNNPNDSSINVKEALAIQAQNQRQAHSNITKGKVEKKTKSIGHYIIGKAIGQGTFGLVKLGTHNLTGEKVAVKILEKDKITEEADVERVEREIKILKLIRHPNIIQLYEIIETPRQLYLIMEYASGGELFDYIVANSRLKEKEACKFFQQIISGVEYLHQLNIVHRDLKPENLLLDHNNNIKLVDFGLSNTYETGDTLKTACGSPCYAAPEMIAGERYFGSKVDVWSCGVILFAMVCGYLPFEDPDTAKLYKKILKGDVAIPSHVSSNGKELIKKILNTDPDTRYTAEQIKQHPWYQQFQPVCKNQGLIIGKNVLPIEPQIVEMLEQFGFKADYAQNCLNNNKHNQVTTVYYLLHKRYEQQGILQSYFFTEKKTIEQSQPQPLPETVQSINKQAGKPQQKENNQQKVTEKITEVNLKKIKPAVAPKLNMSAIDDRESDPINKSMQESQREDKDKINKTFNSGSNDVKPAKAPKMTADSQQKARKLLQNFDFNKLFNNNRRVARDTSPSFRDNEGSKEELRTSSAPRAKTSASKPPRAENSRVNQTEAQQSRKTPRSINSRSGSLSSKGSRAGRKQVVANQQINQSTNQTNGASSKRSSVSFRGKHSSNQNSRPNQGLDNSQIANANEASMISTKLRDISPILPQARASHHINHQNYYPQQNYMAHLDTSQMQPQFFNLSSQYIDNAPQYYNLPQYSQSVVNKSQAIPQSAFIQNIHQQQQQQLMYLQNQNLAPLQQMPSNMIPLGKAHNIFPFTQSTTAAESAQLRSQINRKLIQRRKSNPSYSSGLANYSQQSIPLYSQNHNQLFIDPNTSVFSQNPLYRMPNLMNNSQIYMPQMYQASMVQLDQNAINKSQVIPPSSFIQAPFLNPGGFQTPLTQLADQSMLYSQQRANPHISAQAPIDVQIKQRKAISNFRKKLYSKSKPITVQTRGGANDQVLQNSSGATSASRVQKGNEDSAQIQSRRFSNFGNLNKTVINEMNTENHTPGFDISQDQKSNRVKPQTALNNSIPLQGSKLQSKVGDGKQQSMNSQNPSLPITIIQTPHVNNINNYHNYNINKMTFNQDFAPGSENAASLIGDPQAPIIGQNNQGMLFMVNNDPDLNQASSQIRMRRYKVQAD